MSMAKTCHLAACFIKVFHFQWFLVSVSEPNIIILKLHEVGASHIMVS